MATKPKKHYVCMHESDHDCLFMETVYTSQESLLKDLKQDLEPGQGKVFIYEMVPVAVAELPEEMIVNPIK